MLRFCSMLSHAYTLRDILSWVNFINITSKYDGNTGILDPSHAFIHGASMIFLDGIDTGEPLF